jgi:hypothetical protein
MVCPEACSTEEAKPTAGAPGRGHSFFDGYTRLLARCAVATFNVQRASVQTACGPVSSIQ